MGRDGTLAGVRVMVLTSGVQTVFNGGMLVLTLQSSRHASRGWQTKDSCRTASIAAPGRWTESGEQLAERQGQEPLLQHLTLRRSPAAFSMGLGISRSPSMVAGLSVGGEADKDPTCWALTIAFWR